MLCVSRRSSRSVEPERRQVLEPGRPGADRSATSTTASATHSAATGRPASAAGTRPRASTASAWNGWGCVTGTRPAVASNTTAARSSRPVTGAPSHWPRILRVAGPSTHATGGMPSSSAARAVTSGRTRGSGTCPSGRSFTSHCSGVDHETPGSGSRGTPARTATISAGGRIATDSRVTRPIVGRSCGRRGNAPDGRKPAAVPPSAAVTARWACPADVNNINIDG